jgi:hypothetical protein
LVPTERISMKFTIPLFFENTGGAKNIYTFYIITVAIRSSTFAKKMALIK